MAIGMIQHYYMFPYEYKLSVLQSTAQDYAPFIMIAAVIIGGTVATMLSFGGSPPSISAINSSLPSMTPANNKGSSSLGNTKANNKGSSPFNLGGNNRKNNVASSSFMTV